MQKKHEYPARSFTGNNPKMSMDKKRALSRLELGATKEHPQKVGLEDTSLNPLTLFPGISFSLLFRVLLVSRIYRARMALFCRKNYGLDPNVLITLVAASEGSLQQGMLARSLGIHRNAMVFLVDKLELLRLIKRVRILTIGARGFSNALLKERISLRR